MHGPIGPIGRIGDTGNIGNMYTTGGDHPYRK
jgi:hypothetical protein